MMKANQKPRRGSKLAARPKRTFSDKFWHDKDGRLVVFQPPNPFIVTWAISFMLSQFIRSEPLQSIFSWIALVALVIWAANEMLFGVNYFRRALGAVILLLSVAVRF